MVNSAQLYGRSLGFPPRVGANGQMVWSEGEQNVRESIEIILRTRPGERLLLPEFGCELERYLFEPNNTSTLRLIQEEVKRAINRWEPRVRLDDVIVETMFTQAELKHAIHREPRVGTDDVIVETIHRDERVVNVTIFFTLVATQVRDKLSMTLSTQS